jgi:hypothetical protein
MPDNMEKITFITEDNENLTFFVEEQTRVNGVNYLLVSDAEGEEAQAYILKDVSEDTDPEAKYEFVEDDIEWEAVAKLFDQMLEDVDLQA